MREITTTTCSKCFAEIAESSAFCSECGARLKEDTVDSLYSEGSDREVYPEIAKANLLRMQGQYPEAEAVCIGILRRYPGNETAHALLGDIHLDQGQLDDAIHWYEMVSDMAPANVMYRAKLDQLRAYRAAQEEQRLKPPIELPAAEPAPTNVPYTPSARLWIYALLGIVSLILIVSAFLTGRRLGEDKQPLENTTNTNRAILQPPSPSTNNNPSNPALPPVSPPISGAPIPILMNPSEIAFSNALQQKLNVSRVIALTNPLSGEWALRLRIDTGALTEERVLREVLMAAFTALELKPELMTIRVTLFVPDQQQVSDEMLFSAQIQRANPPLNPAQMTDDEVKGFFQTNRFQWNPAIPLQPGTR